MTTTTPATLNRIIGDLFPATEELARSGQKVIIAHCCNDVGAWGSGFVVPLGNRHPEARNEFYGWAKAARLGANYRGLPYKLGQTQFVKSHVPNITVANMVGQHGIGNDANGEPPIRYDELREAMKLVANEAINQGALICCPQFGCVRAGGTWACIQSLIVDVWVSEGISVNVYSRTGNFS